MDSKTLNIKQIKNGKATRMSFAKTDVPFVMGYNMFLAILTVIGTLLSDIMYSVVDPRVKLGK